MYENTIQTKYTKIYMITLKYKNEIVSIRICKINQTWK